MKYAISLLLLLGGVWLLWSGKFSGLLLTLGLISCLGVVLITFRMRIMDREATPVELIPRALLYTPWILWQIVKANIDVTRRILTPSLPIRPTVIRIPASQKSDLGRVIYGNSITLTPGTVTLEISGDQFTVHALTQEAAEGVLSGEMDMRVSRLENRR